MAYLTQLDKELQEKKQKNKELLQRIQPLAPSGDTNILEEENAWLCEKLKKLQAELKVGLLGQNKLFHLYTIWNTVYSNSEMLNTHLEGSQ